MSDSAQPAPWSAQILRDDIPDDAIPARSAYYQPQLDAYRRMLSDAVESTVANPTLVFLHPKGI